MHAHLMPVRIFFRVMAVVGVLGTMVLQNPADSFALAAGTSPIPISIGWSQEALNGLSAINNFRAQQTPPQEPLQVDAVLQYAAAWEVNDQMTNGQCFGQRASRQQPNYYPYAPLTTSPLATCPHTDSLGRYIDKRIAAFGYTGGSSENAAFYANDTNPISLTKGQDAFQGWYDLADPDANGNPTYAHRKNMINPSWRVVGLAQQCDLFLHRCFWVFDPGTCLMQPFTPTGGPNPLIPQNPQNPVPACAGAGTPVTLPPATLQLPSTLPSFAGTWNVDKFDVVAGGTITLTQTGNQVTGTFSYPDPSGCTVSGNLSGAVTLDLLTFNTSYTQSCGVGRPPYFGIQRRITEDGQSFGGGPLSWNGTRVAAATAAAGAPWVIGTNDQVTSYNAQVANPQTVDGLAVRVALGSSGQPWVATLTGGIYRRSKGPTSYVDGTWQQLPGSAQALSIGADGTAWMVGVNTSVSTFTPTLNAWNPDPDQAISYFDTASSTWKAVDGAAKAIAVGPDGQPWTVNSTGSVYRRSKGPTGYADGSWQPLTGAPKALTVSVGGDGSAWVIGTDNSVSKFDPTSNTWPALPGAAGVRISVDAQGTPWVIDSGNVLWRYQAGNWSQVATATLDVAAQ
jgi:Tectonin domain/Cysteine-rich secretory protein family